MKSVCFICGIESREFDNASDSESDRVSNRIVTKFGVLNLCGSHYLWSYSVYKQIHDGKVVDEALRSPTPRVKKRTSASKFKFCAFVSSS
jgi:hypothetical protein